MAEAATPPAVPDALHRELTQERIQSARRINLVRVWGVSAFFALFLVLGGLLRLPAWTGNLDLFAIYWLITVAVYVLSRRVERVARVASLAVALVDMPMVFFLQWATFPTSPSASGVAGFTVGVYVLLVILSALSLENWFIFFTAAVGAAFEVTLQELAGVSTGAMASTVILLGLAAFSCAYARSRLVDLVARVDRNLAEQRRAERALRQSERMASLGTLAAGVAHEINTPLTYVVTNLALVAERLPRRSAPAGGGDLDTRLAEIEKAMADTQVAIDYLVGGVTGGVSGRLAHDVRNWHTTVIFRLDTLAERLARLKTEVGPLEQIDRMVEQARDGAERVRRIVRDLKTFSRPDEDVVAPVDVWRVIESSVNLASSAIQQRACLRTDLAPVPPVLANETRLGQVFVNLLLNAAQAIPEGAAARNEVRVVTRTDETGRAVVEVHDTGSGIPPEIVGRLFDPFFTTKPVGEGTGLGLSICHGIVASLGGELTVESEVGRGSTFRVTLPPSTVSTARPVTPGGVTPPARLATPTRRGRILIIDDDPRIGEAVRECLLDHDVVALTSASDALQRLTAGERFDLILCDLMMPGMTGMDLHQALSTAAPANAARMVFLTGGAYTARAQAFLAEVSNARLDKPFDPTSLRHFVAISLENRGSGVERISG
ncbi:MAG: hypothetical protein AUH30_01785 [Candidatus Rokubacteria bacterium 13_1_40CM_68_15]|nr:MAG: hypothetical protein AUH30_01785 [Candidatus Rokubacteria bacterium 13_1_40CM_68_15]